jgi:hypothetical protein
MRKLFSISLTVILAIFVLGIFAPNASVADEGGARSDHALYFDGSTPPDTAIYCGVAENGDSRKAYTLHISGTASGSAGSFLINFLDSDVMGFLVPADSTVSTTQALGGVPGVDTTVKITATGGVHSMMASVLAAEGAKDPFKGDGRNNNFCVTINVTGTDNNGLTIKLTTPHPASWDTSGHLN